LCDGLVTGRRNRLKPGRLHIEFMAAIYAVTLRSLCTCWKREPNSALNVFAVDEDVLELSDVDDVVDEVDDVLLVVEESDVEDEVASIPPGGGPPGGGP